MSLSIIMPKGYQKSRTSVHFMHYHFVWCPKYRRAILVNDVKKRLTDLINEKADELGCTIINLSINPDHVHLFIQALPTQAPNKIIGMIKGYTSKILREEFPHLKSKLPSLWTRSYFVSTYGHVSTEIIEKYIENQKGV